MGEIVWHRWLIYFVFGVPFLCWLFFSRNNALRIAAVVSVIVFVQDSFADRRYLWAFGIGPSVITMYVALIACLVARRRFPPLGSVGLAWFLLMTLAFAGILIGARTGGLEQNVLAFQVLYIEGFLFFSLGAVAFVRDDEVKRFSFLFVVIGLGAALGHYFTLVTGFRFADFAQAGDPGTAYIYGAFFNNPNTMGSFYCMAIPIALLLLTAGKLPAGRRLLVAVSLLAMVGSLLLAVHRGGILTTLILSFLVLASARSRPSRAVAIAGVGLVCLFTSYWLVSRLLPEFTSMAWSLAAWKGAESARYQLWPIVIGIVLDHPFGVGLTPENLQVLILQRGMDLASPHDLYLTLAVETGLLGLVTFLYILVAIAERARRAWRLAADFEQRRVLTLTLLGMAAFLIVGVTESVWENGEKLHHTFWLFCGITFGTSVRVLAGARQRREESQPATLLQQAQANGV